MTLPAYAMSLGSFPRMYEGLLVESLFRPWADVVLDRVALTPGERLLDVACGTGIVARRAWERTAGQARIVGVDLSEPMLGVAREIAPQVDWREGDAAALPLGPDETFDVVVCQQGLQFVADRPAAAREMRRSLAPGGRLAVETWRPLGEVPLFKALHDAARPRLGDVLDQRHALGDGCELERLLEDAGLEGVAVETVRRTIRFADADVYVHMNAIALVGMSKLSAGLPPAEREELVEAVVADSAAAAAPFRDGDGLAFEVSTNLAIGLG